MAGTKEQEKEWADFAKQMGYYDFHQLDICHCGGTLDCWTKRYTDQEIQENGLYYRFRSEWICAKCEDVTDQVYDDDMNEIRNNKYE